MGRHDGGNTAASKDPGDAPLRRPQSMLVDNVGRCGPCTFFRRTTEGETVMTGDREGHDLEALCGPAGDIRRISAPDRRIYPRIMLRPCGRERSCSDAAGARAHGRDQVENLHKL